MLKKLVNQILVIATFSLIHQVNISSYTPTREYPSTIIASLDFLDGSFFSTESFFSSSEPTIEEQDGDAIINPYPKYNLYDLQQSMNEFSIALGNKEPINYLGSVTAQSAIQSMYGLTYDLKQDRSIIGQTFEGGFAIKDIFKNIEFNKDSASSKRNKDRLSNIDFFFTTSLTAMQASTNGVYERSMKVTKDINENIDKSYEEYEVEELQLQAINEELNKIRIRMHNDLGFNTYSSNQSGVNDISIKLGLKKCFIDSPLKSKRVDVYSGLIFTLPSGQKAKQNESLSFNFGYPVPTIGVIGGIDILLKRDLSVGCGFLYNFGYKALEEKRIAIGAEPVQLSPLVSKGLSKHGSTFSCTPNIKWKNALIERLDVRLGLAYTLHNKDFTVEGSNSLKIIPGTARAKSGYNAKINELLMFEDFSKWETRLVELKLNYRLGNCEDAEKGNSNLFVSFQKPFDGFNIIKNYKLSAGFNYNF